MLPVSWHIFVLYIKFCPKAGFIVLSKSLVNGYKKTLIIIWLSLSFNIKVVCWDRKVWCLAQRRYGGQNGGGSLKRYASWKKGFVHVKKCNRDIQYIKKNVYISHFTICKQQNLLNWNAFSNWKQTQSCNFSLFSYFNIDRRSRS